MCLLVKRMKKKKCNLPTFHFLKGVQILLSSADILNFDTNKRILFWFLRIFDFYKNSKN